VLQNIAKCGFLLTIFPLFIEWQVLAFNGGCLVSVSLLRARFFYCLVALLG
jgi:hypothetical protein